MSVNQATALLSACSSTPEPIALPPIEGAIEIEDQIVETEMGNLPYKGWSRFGPYPVDLSDGELNIVLTTADPEQKAEVMGMLLIKPDNSGSL